MHRLVLISLLLSLSASLVACDPVWRVENVATAKATTRTDAACIEAGLAGSGFAVASANDSYAPPVRGWLVGDPGRTRMRVSWDPRTAQTIQLAIAGVGTQAPHGAPEAYRQMRDTVIAKLGEACGPFDVGPESCARVPCAGSAVQ